MQMTKKSMEHWLKKQMEANKQGNKAKLYYKATKQGVTPYKYIEIQGNKKIVIIIEEE